MNSKTIGACLVLCLVFAQTKPAHAQESTQQEDIKRLKYLNSLYIQSFIHSDTTTYDKMLWAEDFMQQNSDGTLLLRKDCMKRFGWPRFGSIQYFFVDNVEVRFITRDVAMVFARNPYAFSGNEPSIGEDQYNDVYVRRNGKWVCVSANITSIKQQ